MAEINSPQLGIAVFSPERLCERAEHAPGCVCPKAQLAHPTSHRAFLWLFPAAGFPEAAERTD